MSKIEFSKEVGPLRLNYEDVLRRRINQVCQKIGFDDSRIIWTIFNAKNKRAIDSVLVGLKGEDYGYCVPKENKIFISIQAIQRDSLSNPINKIVKVSGKKENNFLADVILDEITHIQTRSNHGDGKYENQLNKNRRKYYFSPIK